MQLSEIRKAVVTGLGMVVTIGTFLLPMITDLSPQAAALIGSVVGVATIVLNYLAPNETTDPNRAVGRSLRVKGEQPLPDVT